MNSLHEWREKLSEQAKPAEKKPEEKKVLPRLRAKKLKKDGSIPVDKTVAARIDLIVLPPEVEGANCGNCEHFDKQGDVGYCSHDQVRQWVTSRMCCSLWDHGKVKRSWKSKAPAEDKSA